MTTHNKEYNLCKNRKIRKVTKQKTTVYNSRKNKINLRRVTKGELVVYTNIRFLKIKRYKEGHYILVKGSGNQDYITIKNI